MSSESLLADIDDFLAKTGWSETAFGIRAMNDGKFVRELRAGRRMWPETAEKVSRFISAAKAGRAA